MELDAGDEEAEHQKEDAEADEGFDGLGFLMDVDLVGDAVKHAEGDVDEEEDDEQGGGDLEGDDERVGAEAGGGFEEGSGAGADFRADLPARFDWK